MRSGVDEAQWKGHGKILTLLLATAHCPLQEEKRGGCNVTVSFIFSHSEGF
jgi:hypothetical protein